MYKVSEIGFDHQRTLVTNSRDTNATEGKLRDMPPGTAMTTSSFVVSNRTIINNVLYTNEDAPEPVLPHIPPIICPNGEVGTMYFSLDITCQKQSVSTTHYHTHKRCHYLQETRLRQQHTPASAMTNTYLAHQTNTSMGTNPKRWCTGAEYTYLKELMKKKRMEIRQQVNWIQL